MIFFSANPKMASNYVNSTQEATTGVLKRYFSQYDACNVI